MKWINKGHEFDKLANEICNVKKIAIFGAGINGAKIYNELKDTVEIIGFIDNDTQKQNDGYLGLKVFSANEIHNLNDGTLTVVISTAPDELLPQMNNLGFKTNVNLFYLRNKFPSVYLWYKYHKLNTNHFTLSVTEKCNLNCKKCSICTPLIEHPKHIELNQLKKDVDAFFNIFDTVGTIQIYGGEPFLYPQLDEIIDYIFTNYGLRILIDIQITTNAMVKAQSNILNSLSRHDKLLITISDYTITLSQFKNNVTNFVNTLNENNIKYKILPSNEKWVDFGYDSVDRKEDNECDIQESIRIFDECNMQCSLVKNGKFYVCNLDGFALNAGFISEDSGIDLYDTSDENKVRLLEYDYGYNEKGYVGLCRKCNGYVNNTNYIPAAEQIPRKFK